MQDVSETERADLARIGVSVPTGIAVKGSRWIFTMGDRDRLIDVLARDWFVGKVALLPADVSPVATGDLAARLCRSLARTAVARAIRLADDWASYADVLTARHNAVGPMFDRPTLVETLAPATPRQVMHASVNPMGYARWSMGLEHAGSQLLRAMNLPASRPDVWNAARRTHVARPDSVAYRGQARFVRPAPCRYGKNGLQAACEYVPATIWQADSQGDVTARADTWSHAELLTAMGRQATARHAVTLEERDSQGRLIGRRTAYGTVRLPDDGTRRGWRGHRAVTWQAAPRQSSARTLARQAARAARATAGATAARGPAVGPWSASTHNLARVVRTRGLEAAVTALEAALRAANDHSLVTFADGTQVTISGPGEVLAGDRAYGVREYARRAALAGVTVA